MAHAPHRKVLVITTPEELNAAINGLVDAWCARRELRPLAIILRGWPVPQWMTDHCEALHAALKGLFPHSRGFLPPQEAEVVHECYRYMDQILNKRD